MEWKVAFHQEFEREFDEFSQTLQDAILVQGLMLAKLGPNLSRPYADTLHGSRHANMKELRLRAEGGVWRIAFAFDPQRKAILLTAGNKAGMNQRRFYKSLIAKADSRFSQYLAIQKGTK